MGLVWFCKDIERVYIGKKIPNTAKNVEATNFKKKKLIDDVDINALSESKYLKNTSNIAKVLGKYLRVK